MSEQGLRTAQESGDRLGSHLSVLLEALGRVRAETTPASVIDVAPRELCATGIFDRVMVSRVRGSTWLPQLLYAYNSGAVTQEIDGDDGGPVEDLQVPLASPLVEAEVVRRRLPALVQDAQHEPRTFRALIERTGTREYVVAPVVAGSAVIALVHADTTTLGPAAVHPGPRSAATVRRRCRADLRARGTRRTRRTAAPQGRRGVRGGYALTRRPRYRPDAGLRRHGDRYRCNPGTGRPRRERFDAPRDPSRLSRLTVREREVLALLASGVTNAQLADRLTVAESTVKSHVKHILHKLGAGNRAAAIAYYLRENRVDERRPR